MNNLTLIKLIVLYITLHLFFGCVNTNGLVDDGKTHYRFAFYNVENLFDTLDAPVKLDEEFTPTSEKEWTTERYYTKLNRIRRVINTLDNPIAMGLCEVENEQVLKDLVNPKSFAKNPYEYIHYESPDMRGIDVAFIYQKKHLKVMEHDIIRIDFPKEVIEDYTTRDILHVKAMTPKKEIIHFYVNHWPSRYGGVKESEPKRVYVAKQLKKEIEKLQQNNPKEGFVLLGDFNDEPKNKSITKVLEATGDKDSEVFCCHCELAEAGEGTYNYRGDWNMMDQFFVSKNMMDDKNIQFEKAGVLKNDWLFFTHPKYGKTPTRTYGGPIYYAGYSDHLPIYIDLKKN